jgi:Mrp family chromosome partitioning ATPase
MTQSSTLTTGAREAIAVDPAEAESKPKAEQKSAKPPSTDLHGETLALAESVLARLPANGAIVVCGSLSPADDQPSFAAELGMGMQLISAKPALLIELGAQADSNEAGGRPGIMEVLRHEATLSQAVQVTVRSELKILASGRRDQNSAQLIVSNVFREFLESARAQFRWIILHNHRLMEGDESLSIVSRSDAMVATLRRGVGRSRDVAAARRLCEQFQTEFLGVVLT